MDKEDLDHFKTIALAQVGQQVGSQRLREEVNSHLVRDPNYTLQKAQMIFSCYRKDETQDPEIYAAAVAAVLSGYPKGIIDYVCDPRTGIAGVSKWLPSVSEIKEACESKVNEIGRARERQERIERQFMERDRDEKLDKERSEARATKAKAWLDRTDPKAQELSGQKPKVLTEAQKKAALDDAALVGKSIAGMRLLPETLATLEGEQSDLLDAQREDAP